MAETIDMTDFPKILNTEIIDAEADAFWVLQHSITDGLSPKEILVITSPISPESPEAGQLNKIIAACKIQEGNYNTIQIDKNEKVAWNHLKNTLNPRHVITFGINPKQLGISALFALNSKNHFDDTIIIPTLSLNELEQQPNAKKELWVNALKPIFADK